MREAIVPPARLGEEWFSPSRFALALAVMIIIPFRQVLAGGECFVARDFGIFSYPVASYLRDSFWRGEWPLWNPLSCCGTPFLAQLNTLALYPPSLIYILLPLSWSLPVFCLTHLFFGGLGMYFLAANWSGSRAGGALAGTVFAFNGLALNLIMWPSHIATYALAPWVIGLTMNAWREGGRKLILAALVAALQVLAGGPETILFTWLFLGLVAAIRFYRGEIPRLILARRFLLIGLIALGLAAAQLLPFMDLSLHSNRQRGFGNSAWAIQSGGLADFLVPLFGTLPFQQMVEQNSQYWTSSFYFGVGAVLLVAVALVRTRGWRTWLPGALLILAVLLALGDQGYLFAWAVKTFPFLSLFRYPVKFVLLILLMAPLLAAQAVSFYQSSRPRSLFFLKGEMIVGTGLLLAIGFIVAQAPAATATVQFIPRGQVAANGAVRAVFFTIFVLVLTTFALRENIRRWTGPALALICWLDLLTHMPWQNPSVDASVYQRDLGVLRAKFQPLAPAAGQSRIVASPFSSWAMYYHVAPEVKEGFLLDRAAFLSDCNLLDGVPKVDGFFSLYLYHMDKVLSLFDTNTVSRLGQLYDAMAVSQTTAPGTVYDWIARPGTLPWISAGQRPVFADDREALRALANTNSDFREVVYLPTEAWLTVKAGREPDAKITTRFFGANRIVLQAESPDIAMVYLAQAWHHNWQAKIDGQPTTLWRANEAFQAVQTPAGKHLIELDYVDTAFREGGGVSLVTLLACGLGWFLLSPAKRTPGKSLFESGQA